MLAPINQEVNIRNIGGILKNEFSKDTKINKRYDFSHMLEEEEKKHIEAIEKTKELFEIINSKLDDEGRRALIQLVDLKDVIAVQEGDYYFERGVRVGLTDLSYLNKYFNAF